PVVGTGVRLWDGFGVSGGVEQELGAPGSWWGAGVPCAWVGVSGRALSIYSALYQGRASFFGVSRQACAHRYTRVLWSGSEDQRRMVGRCYVRGNDLRLNLSDEWQTYHNEMCNSNVDAEETGMCQMGTSAGFTSNIIYFGAPGAYNWQGTNYMLKRETWDLHDFSYPNEKNGNTYIGYTAEVGSGVLQEDAVTVVAGAPRYQHTGAVYLLSTSPQNTLEKSSVLRGHQVGSYFGSAVALADLNNDGGAWTCQGALWQPLPHVGGADPPLPPTDIAVGAPFEGAGKVYIYHSSAGGLLAKPSQVVSGSDLGPASMQTFGYSLSGGLDVDGNSYPDLLVGSLAERVALLRARPVLNILDKTFTVTPSKVDPARCTPSIVCVQWGTRACGTHGSAPLAALEYVLEADKERHPPRVRFLGTHSATYRGVFPMPETRCESKELLLLENIRDKLHPIVLSMNYSLVEKPRSFQLGPHSLDAFPVLNRDQSHENETKIEFQKECGSDNKCYSNLQMQSGFVNEQNQFLPRLNGTQVLQYSRDLRKLHLGVNITNVPSTDSNGEDAHEAQLNVTVPPNLLFSSVRPSGACTSMEETVLCELGNPFKKNQRVELFITFEVNSMALDTREVLIWLDLSTTPTRQRRELGAAEAMEPPLTLATAKKAKSEVLLSCSQGTARCVWFECPLLDTQRPTTFRVRARVWNSTFIEVSAGGGAGLPPPSPPQHRVLGVSAPGTVP
uniref:Integrin subunit alpha 3 n=1 Tax=Anser cygnoides TaxID=8845 RepID=A0A8B9EI83_ANSCY